MLTGKELGDAIAQALQQNDKTQADATPTARPATTTAIDAMNEAATQASPETSSWLKFARHAVGVSVLLAFDPFHGVINDIATDWAITTAGVFGLCAVIWGLYALFFTARAKRNWPKSFVILLWVCSALYIVGRWQEYHTLKSAQVTPAASVHKLV